MRPGPCSSPAIWTEDEHAILDALTSPGRIQAFLDETPYSTEPIYRSPRSVMRDRRAHCFDGAMFAAAALRRLDHPPLLLDLRAERDDDHVIALFRRGRHIGAVAKSNFAGLRYREPIFRSLRELALSYFHDYYNLDYEMSLRAYSIPLDLRRFDGIDWEVSDAGLDRIAQALDRIRHFPLATPQMIARCDPMDERSYRSGMVGVDMAGVFVPEART